MKNKTKLKKAGIAESPHTPVYALGTLIIDVRTSTKHRRYVELQDKQPNFKFFSEGRSVLGKSYHVKPSLLK